VLAGVLDGRGDAGLRGHGGPPVGHGTCKCRF
jgi:hypothetical protein